MSKVLVVAANNHESTDWLVHVTGWKVKVFDHYRPAGRETDTYLNYICYNEWPDELVLCHGCPFDHDPHFIDHLSNPDVRYYGMTEHCDPVGMPRVEWCELDAWCRILGLPIQTQYHFVAGAQYRLTKEQLAVRSLDFYKALYYLTKIQENRTGFEPHWNVPESRSAYVLERIWPLIWNVKL